MIKGPIKIVIIGPEKSGKTQLVEKIKEALNPRDIVGHVHMPSIAIYDGDDISGPTRADIIVMTVQCTADQFNDPVELLRGY